MALTVGVILLRNVGPLPLVASGAVIAWLTSRLNCGPIHFGIAGAAVAGAAIFLPSFLMILSILPLLNKMKNLQWLRAFMRGVGPAVIGALAVSLVQMAPHAAPDVFTWILMALTVGAILLRNVGPLPLVASGAVIGLLAKNEFVERLAEWA